jgi:hypothetical protein
VLSLVTGFLATIASEKLASQKLDASTGASEPHDFAVRLSAVRQRRLRVHRIPLHVRDDRETPLVWDRMAIDKPVICVGRKQEYFSCDDWTGQISLKSQENFGYARTRENLSGSPHERSDMRDSLSKSPGYRGACYRARIRATRWLMRATLARRCLLQLGQV